MLRPPPPMMKRCSPSLKGMRWILLRSATMISWSLLMAASSFSRLSPASSICVRDTLRLTPSRSFTRLSLASRKCVKSTDGKTMERTWGASSSTFVSTAVFAWRQGSRLPRIITQRSTRYRVMESTPVCMRTSSRMSCVSTAKVAASTGTRTSSFLAWSSIMRWAILTASLLPRIVTVEPRSVTVACERSSMSRMVEPPLPMTAGIILGSNVMRSVLLWMEEMLCSIFAWHALTASSRPWIWITHGSFEMRMLRTPNSSCRALTFAPWRPRIMPYMSAGYLNCVRKALRSTSCTICLAEVTASSDPVNVTTPFFESTFTRALLCDWMRSMTLPPGPMISRVISGSNVSVACWRLALARSSRPVIASHAAFVSSRPPRMSRMPSASVLMYTPKSDCSWRTVVPPGPTSSRVSAGSNVIFSSGISFFISLSSAPILSLSS
eukprot:PhM_4_TR9209/c0_g1_i1/m.17310